jgi:hypothetical protein
MWVPTRHSDRAQSASRRPFKGQHAAHNGVLFHGPAAVMVARRDRLRDTVVGAQNAGECAIPIELFPRTGSLVELRRRLFGQD